MNFKQLRQFRQTIYNNIGASKDALFELMDATLCSPSIPSFVSLSQHPFFRRQLVLNALRHQWFRHRVQYPSQI